MFIYNFYWNSPAEKIALANYNKASSVSTPIFSLFSIKAIIIILNLAFKASHFFLSNSNPNLAAEVFYLYKARFILLGVTYSAIMIDI